MSAAKPVNTDAVCPRCGERARAYCVQGRWWFECANACITSLIPGPEATPVHHSGILDLPVVSIANLVHLARLFPSLRGAYGLRDRKWDPVVLIAWLNRADCPAQAVHAGRFVLSLASPFYDWCDAGLDAPGRFDVFAALASWDGEHAAAFRSWVESPFQP